MPTQLTRQGLEADEPLSAVHCPQHGGAVDEALRLQGVRREKVVRTTICDMKVPCPLDQVNFTVRYSGRLTVSGIEP